MLTEGVDFLGTTQESPIEIISETGAEEEKNVPSIFRLRIRFKLGRIIIVIYLLNLLTYSLIWNFINFEFFF